MKSSLRLIALTATLVFGSGAQASQTYDYSYKLYDGPTASGSFTGDASGNLITNLLTLRSSSTVRHFPDL